MYTVQLVPFSGTSDSYKLNLYPAKTERIDDGM